ncbi:MAG: hypothetical protein ABFS42_00925 [Candidatus Krumholzibacteriota bacterium]
MKKLLFAVSALAALSLLAPSTGFAQHESSANNQLGLFLAADGTGATGSADIGVPVSVFLVLINPTDVDAGEAPYATLNAFECMLNFDGPALFKLADTLPPTAVNVGDNSDINQGFLEYIVGLGTSMDVSAASATLISFQFMTTSPLPTTITLTQTSAPSIANEMAFQSVTGQLRVMHNASGTKDGIVFAFNGEPVAIENESFGSVKALFR